MFTFSLLAKSVDSWSQVGARRLQWPHHLRAHTWSRAGRKASALASSSNDIQPRCKSGGSLPETHGAKNLTNQALPSATGRVIRRQTTGTRRELCGRMRGNGRPSRIGRARVGAVLQAQSVRRHIVQRHACHNSDPFPLPSLLSKKLLGSAVSHRRAAEKPSLTGDLVIELGVRELDGAGRGEDGEGSNEERKESGASEHADCCRLGEWPKWGRRALRVQDSSALR